MPSRRRRARPDPEALVFFVDRSLGRHDVPAVFRQAGFRVVLMRDYYPNGSDQFVDDDVWIADISREGWVALTKDASILHAHRADLARSTLRVFALDNSNLTGQQMADRFEQHVHRIARRARRAGPYLDVVHRDRIERRWGRGS